MTTHRTASGRHTIGAIARSVELTALRRLRLGHNPGVRPRLHRRSRLPLSRSTREIRQRKHHAACIEAARDVPPGTRCSSSWQVEKQGGISMKLGSKKTERMVLLRRNHHSGLRWPTDRSAGDVLGSGDASRVGRRPSGRHDGQGSPPNGWFRRSGQPALLYWEGGVTVAGSGRAAPTTSWSQRYDREGARRRPHRPLLERRRAQAHDRTRRRRAVQTTVFERVSGGGTPRSTARRRPRLHSREPTAISTPPEAGTSGLAGGRIDREGGTRFS